ncbi:MAG TPA: hypothetical protein VEY50_03680 [Lysobacter sp.]|nr:hypothetical protein [Lysobacter sp.]
MSTVLWANVLAGGAVVSDQQDRHALYKHADRLDALARELGLPSFAAACDTTDARYNTQDLPLPDGATSTNDVMAASGAWLSRGDGERLLAGLLEHIRAKQVRFGLLRNQHDEVVRELEDVLAFVRAQPAAERFNFAVVM